MRMKLYNLLVNKKAGICMRYHEYHDNNKSRILAWIYLLWLNFAFYILRIKSIGEPIKANITSNITEEKNVFSLVVESALNSLPSAKELAERLLTYDVISFDVFDTLILRPFSSPKDLFYFLEEALGINNFHELRAKAERNARQKQYELEHNYEVTLDEIWAEIELELGGMPRLCKKVFTEKNLSTEKNLLTEKNLSTEKNLFTGKELEISLELSLCFANPYFKEVFEVLKGHGKEIIIISDMYMPQSFFKELLEKNGYEGISKIYISNQYRKSKASGELYETVKADYPDAKMIHIGDNERSDIKNAKAAGIEAFYYPNVNKYSEKYRAYDMSPVVGGAYRGVVNSHIYAGKGTSFYPYSMEYEYGFIYGGLFVLGYCHFIHDYVKKNNIDKVLFLSRDGEMLQKAYTYLFPEEDTEYVYWSRKAATKLGAFYNREDYFRRFINHKINQKQTIADILHSMELDFLLSEGTEEILTEKNAQKLKDYITDNWDRVLAFYQNQLVAAGTYYKNILSGSKKAVAVDIGWAGSGAMTLRHLIMQEWNLETELIGIVAGTNTIHNAEPDAAEAFLQSGKLVAYLYSQAHNRDLMKIHNPAKNYNLFWELFLSSKEPTFKGFYPGDMRKEFLSENECVGKSVYDPKLDITLAFGKYDENPEGIADISYGIMDFVRSYHSHFKNFPFMENISGRDAYAPMLLAANMDVAYLETLVKRFNPKIGI